MAAARPQARRSLEYADIRNRPADIAWAKRKIDELFWRAGVACPPIRVEAA